MYHAFFQLTKKSWKRSLKAEKLTNFTSRHALNVYSDNEKLHKCILFDKEKWATTTVQMKVNVILIERLFQYFVCMLSLFCCMLLLTNQWKFLLSINLLFLYIFIETHYVMLTYDIYSKRKISEWMNQFSLWNICSLVYIFVVEFDKNL